MKSPQKLKKPLVSIIMPVYNGEKHIENTIKSIKNQIYTNFELIIVNDGSTDKTQKICEKYKKTINMKLINKVNEGVSVARNTGIKNASGEYITFIDSDDLYHRNYINKLCDEIISKSSDWVICNYSYFEKINKDIIFEGKINTKKDVIEKLQKQFLFNQLWNKIYKTQIIKKNKITFDKTTDLGEDAIFNIEYLKYCKKINNIPEALYKYRITDSGLGFKYRKNSGELKLKIFYKMNELYDIYKWEKNYINNNIKKQYISWFSDIIDIRNKDSFFTKYKEIKSITRSKQYKEDRKYLKRIFYILFKLTPLAILLGILANFYNKYNKRRHFK